MAQQITAPPIPIFLRRFDQFCTVDSRKILTDCLSVCGQKTVIGEAADRQRLRTTLERTGPRKLGSPQHLSCVSFCTLLKFSGYHCVHHTESPCRNSLSINEDAWHTANFKSLALANVTRDYFLVLSTFGFQIPSEIASFQQVYSEIRGSLSLATPVARQVLGQLAVGRSATLPEMSEGERREHEHQLLEYFSGAIKEKEVAVALRTLHIGALCHAAVRWDKKRKLTGNDLFDFHHAEAAVGYCDVFLTDGPLHTMLEQRHMKIAEYFSCKIISSPEEAASHFAVS